ncbi:MULTISPECIES: DUF1516 family protein [Priestia]|uniref:DUF1516 family protein n=1 Tax=Priestia TaxID=2800373 RepID=UPI0021AD741F|nr:MULTISPECIES: DUF1516 family protein [Priestia]MDN3360774.1 DUF1516 family protein [Priestia megaterium]WKU23216.1 DUF1516 family protein [Priestia megaterium]
MYMTSLHIHVGLWTLLLLAFVISLILHRAGKPKGQKILHMVARLLYLLVLVSGLHLLGYVYHFQGLSPLIKGASGILVLVSMEMVLVRMEKGKSTGLGWIILIIALVLVFYYGYAVLGV